MYFCKLTFFSLTAWIGNFDCLIFGTDNIRHKMKKV